MYYSGSCQYVSSIKLKNIVANTHGEGLMFEVRDELKSQVIYKRV